MRNREKEKKEAKKKRKGRKEQRKKKEKVFVERKERKGKGKGKGKMSWCSDGRGSTIQVLKLVHATRFTCRHQKLGISTNVIRYGFLLLGFLFI